MEPERGRDARKKKYSSRDKEPAKRMVILTKTKETKPEEPMPTILLKTRDNERAVSPQSSTSKSSSRDVETPQAYQLAAKGSSSSAGGSIVAPPQMKESIKLLDDETVMMNDNLLEFLSDSNDFLVVGCIGLQGVGKSTIMSHLANPTSVANPEEMVFRCQSKSHADSNTHCTEGIQCYVSDQRVIFLDSQPVLSLSVLSKHYATEGAGLAVRTCHREDPDYPSLENDVEILFLQQIALLLAVCHVVLVVQDHFYDSDLIKFIQTAEMLKLPSSYPDEESSNYFPHCILLHNKCSQQSFSHANVKSMQESYKAMFSHSQILIQSGIGMANEIFMPSLSPTLCAGEPINLYLLPERRQSLYEVKEYEEVVDLVRSHLHGVPLVPLTHTTLSEKNWLHYAIKVWEDIKKSPLFSEYGRMLPTSTNFKTDHVVAQHPG